MSTQPPPEPDPEPDDDFPAPGEGTTEIQYMVGTRFGGGPITGTSVPGHLIGELITRVSKLYSALRGGGSNLSRAVDIHPFAFRGARFQASVDIFLAVPPEQPDLFENQEDRTVREALDKLSALTAANPADVAALAADHGGAVAMAYRQLVTAVGQREVSVGFFRADDFKPREETFVHLRPALASAQAVALTDRDVLQTQTVSLMGVLDELAGRRGVFKLLRPVELTESQEAAWNQAVGRAQSVEGALTDEAAIDIRRANAWSSLVEVELVLTHMEAPTSTRVEEVEGELTRLISVQPEIDAD